VTHNDVADSNSTAGISHSYENTEILEHSLTIAPNTYESLQQNSMAGNINYETLNMGDI